MSVVTCPCPNCDKLQRVHQANLGKIVSCRDCGFKFAAESEPDPNEKKPATTSLRFVIWVMFLVYAGMCVGLYYFGGSARAVAGGNLVEMLDHKAGLACAVGIGYFVAKALTGMLPAKNAGD